MNSVDLKKIVVSHPIRTLAFALVVVWIFFGKSLPVICTDGSRLATIESLVHRGTFDISESMFISTCDKFRVPAHGENGKYYSDKPPVLSMVGAAAYFVSKFFGLDFRKDLPVLYRLIDFVLVILPILLTLYWMNLYLNAHQIRPEIQFWVCLAAVFGTLVLPYAMVIQNHVAAAAALLGAYIYLENPMKIKTLKALSLSGLLLGLGISMDLNMVFFAGTFTLVCLWYHARSERTACISFLVLEAIPVALTWYFFWLITGEWKPFVSQVEKFFYAGSTLPKINFMGGYDSTPLTMTDYGIYLWQALLGYKGLFSHSIALALGFWGAILLLRKRDKLSLHLAAVVIAIVALLGFLMIAVPITYGGSNFGFRYMTIWMPLIMLFAAFLFREKGVLPMFQVIIGLSILTSSAGLASPWLIHKFKQLDLDTFDFLLVADEASNPYFQLDKTIGSQPEIPKLKANLTRENLIKLAFLHYQMVRPTEALGYLQLLGDSDPEGNCYSAIIFSKRGLNLEDLMNKHVAKCPPEMWKELSDKMGLNEVKEPSK